VALGLVRDAERGIAASVVATYAMMNLQGQAEATAAVMQRLQKKRHEAGAPDAQLLGGFDELATRTAAALEQGEMSADDALQRMLTRTNRALGQPVYGIAVQAAALDEIEVPADLLAKKPLSVVIAVARYKPEGEPWAHYLVIFVTVEAAGTQDA
jgi:hypothetical protein